MQISVYYKRLLKLHKPYWRRLTFAFIAMVVTAATEPIVPYLLKLLLDKGFMEKPNFSYWLVPAAVIGVFAVRGVSTFVSTYMLTWVSSRLLSDLRGEMFGRMLNVSASFYADHSVGGVVNSIMFEVQQIVEMVTKVLTSVVRSSLTVLGLLGWLLYLNWQLTIVTLILLPLIALVVKTTGRRLKQLNKDALQINAQMTQVLEEAARAHQVIKVFNGHAYEKRRFAQQAEHLRRYVMRTTKTFASTVPITQLMTACALAVVIVLALKLSSNGQITAGGFVSFVTAMLMLLTPLKQLAEVNGPLQRGMAAAESVFDLIDAPIERTDGIELKEKARGELQFIDLSFSYPGQAGLALDRINLHVKPGETIALVGMSGGGKTTLASLIPAFYLATSGKILLDGQPVSDISPVSLRRQIAMVSQHVVLFDDTIAANIAYGDHAPDAERIAAAAEAAFLSETIAKLPEKLETRIGDNGARLSGGQRQRLAIARAIYKDAPILILDEATSALDSESERAVQAALDRLMHGRTTFVIAHRLSTIERADRIVVLANGRIVEVGTHADLLQRGEFYANLYHLQYSASPASTATDAA